MKFQTVLAKTTTDIIKSKIRNQQMAELVLECYMTPAEFADLIENYSEDTFNIEITKNDER